MEVAATEVEERAVAATVAVAREAAEMAAERAAARVAAETAVVATAAAGRAEEVWVEAKAAAVRAASARAASAKALAEGGRPRLQVAGLGQPHQYSTIIGEVWGAFNMRIT